MTDAPATTVERTVELPLRVVVFFATNPEEEMTVQDIGVKFDITNVPGIRPSLRRAVRLELLKYEPIEEGRARPKVYRAGTTLLRMLGLMADDLAGDHMLAAVAASCSAHHHADSGTFVVRI